MTDTHDPLDRGRLDSLVDEIGDRDLVRQAVQAFLDEVPDRLAAIRVALVGGDREELRSAVHSLGSPASMLGAVEVTCIARALQEAAPDGDTTTCHGLAEELQVATYRTAEAMRDYLTGAEGD